jgi:tetratricopeptide (TPR) repeat protein
MTNKTILYISMGIACWLSVNGVVWAQIETLHRTADTNNAVIEGRVLLPSGRAVERNVRITLSNARSNLNTFYSDKHGEFQITNLSEGIYYVKADVDDPNYEPVIAKIMLGRGIVWTLNLQIRDKQSPKATAYGVRVISAAELRQAVPPGAKREYNVAQKFVAKRDFLQASVHFKKALDIFPDYIAARNDLGAQYLKLKRLDEAEESFNTVLQVDPRNFNAKFNRGLVRIERRDYPDAITQLNEAIATDSGRAVAHLWLGFALLETGDLAGAERELTKALVMGGAECTASHYHLARIYLNRGDVRGAERSLRAYLEESPNGEYAKEARQLLERPGDAAKRGAKPKQ